MHDPDPLFLDWASQALRHYDLQAPTISFLGHSENMTFQIRAGSIGEQFLLRLHRPLTHTFAGVRQQPHAIRSELCWLDALARDTAIPVPRPVRNRDGG